MKFFKCSDIHFKYIINKQTLLIVLISFIFMLGALIFNTNILSSSASKILFENDYYKSYISNSYNVIIVIYGFFSIFLSIMFFNKYDLYLISRRPKKEIILSKIFTASIILLLYLYLTFCLFIIVPTIFLRGFIFKASFIKDYLLIYLNGIFLWLLSMLLLEIFNNILSSFIILVLYWCMKIFTTPGIKKNSLIYFLNNFFPTLISEEEKIRVYYTNIFSVFIIIFATGMALTYYYVKKDVK